MILLDSFEIFWVGLRVMLSKACPSLWITGWFLCLTKNSGQSRLSYWISCLMPVNVERMYLFWKIVLQICIFISSACKFSVTDVSQNWSDFKKLPPKKLVTGFLFKPLVSGMQGGAKMCPLNHSQCKQSMKQLQEQAAKCFVGASGLCIKLRARWSRTSNSNSCAVVISEDYVGQRWIIHEEVYLRS